MRGATQGGGVTFGALGFLSLANRFNAIFMMVFSSEI